MPFHYSCVEVSNNLLSASHTSSWFLQPSWWQIDTEKLLAQILITFPSAEESSNGSAGQMVRRLFAQGCTAHMWKQLNISCKIQNAADCNLNSIHKFVTGVKKNQDLSWCLFAHYFFVRNYDRLTFILSQTEITNPQINLSQIVFWPSCSNRASRDRLWLAAYFPFDLQKCL